MKLKINEHQINNNNFIMKINFKNLRKNNIATMFAALFIITILNFSCSKPENGTNGTNGVDGKNGIAGANGTNGTTGPAGTANVIYSNWINVTFGAPNGAGNQYGELLVPQITQTVYNSGAVLVYAKGSSDVYPLPYRNDSSFGYFLIDVIGKIRFFTNIPAFTTIPYRYIIIPGGTPAGRGTTTKPDYKNMTYSQVCAKFNIPE